MSQETIPEQLTEAQIVSDVFLDRAYLTYIVPLSTSFQPESLSEGSGDIASRLTNLEKREHLFFGTPPAA